ncbi:NAD(P)/FAD-dependent oxidoreductase [Streptosporangium carneum]|uniref:FAD-binding monooxygenase n=1 Tax=Streptosporangium carneum TaxID=47481 RepID=A0A9W6I4Q3_9ACTN|nr:FAD-binding monooxygenase [Streptosporangium carneum]GLK11391.1 FAD-binding monooxygenase [Streptosporangium carneum]
MSESPIGRAVVLGGSVAGLLAARVLAEFCVDVLVVDRDELTGVEGPRRGVPQGRHTHGVLARGQQVIEELFPGFTRDLAAAGVQAGDIGGQIRWYFNGRRLRPAKTGLIVVGGDRPVLEHHIRCRVAELPNVTFLEGHEVVAPVTAPDLGRVVGARVREPDGAERVLVADLVVDATGRGSRTPAWLAGLGWPAVPEERVRIDLAYTTCRFRLRSDPFHGDVSINPVATPAHPRGAFLTSLGGDRCVVSLTGVLGDRAPRDLAGFLAYARTLPVPDVFDAIRDAQPLEEPVTMRFPVSVRRRYERVRRLPEGLLVMGDAACSFNPVYGQGMTVAALQALTLRRHLRRGAVPVTREFFADAAAVVDAPWEIAAGGDLAFPAVRGRRTIKVRMGNAFLPRVHAAATGDSAVTEAFIRVAGLVDPPRALMRPGLMSRVLRARPARERGARQEDRAPSPAFRASSPDQ